MNRRRFLAFFGALLALPFVKQRAPARNITRVKIQNLAPGTTISLPSTRDEFGRYLWNIEYADGAHFLSHADHS